MKKKKTGRIFYFYFYKAVAVGGVIFCTFIFNSCSVNVKGQYSPLPLDSDFDGSFLDGVEFIAEFNEELPPEGYADLQVQCYDDSDCDDGEECNGVETCSPDGICVAGLSLPDGSPCSGVSGLPGECEGGVCIPSTCGDGKKDSGEECDDGNAIDGDGCESNCIYSCHTDGDCVQDQCVEGSCETGGSGKVCRYSYLTSPCDDGLYCTAVDLCNGEGECIGSLNPCDDSLECTEDFCDEGADGPDCSWRILDGFCLIGGNCYVDGADNPDNECERCSSAQSKEGWSDKPDGTVCGGGSGICCGGECVEGGECCWDSDCPAGCRGISKRCDDFPSDRVCNSQEGCGWTSSGGQCEGTMVCAGITFDASELFSCATCGCSWSMCIDGNCSCRGSGYSCDHFSSQSTCEDCGCTWSGPTGQCSGSHPSCDTFDETICDSQQDCWWSDGICSDHQCI